jgi:hypothetical protein
MDPCHAVLIGFMRLKVIAGLLVALGFLGNAKVLMDDGDKHLQHDDYKKVM